MSGAPLLAERGAGAPSERGAGAVKGHESGAPCELSIPAAELEAMRERLHERGYGDATPKDHDGDARRALAAVQLGQL